jgi:hypothetical protein
VSKVKELREALKAAEEALGRVVERYRLALGCCAVCGDHFEMGDIAVASVDARSRICFEHELCPEDPEDYGSSYRNDQQIDRSGPSSV